MVILKKKEYVFVIKLTLLYGGTHEEEFEFSTDNIKVYVDGKPHRIVIYEDLLKEMNEVFSGRLEVAERQWEAEAFDATQDSVKDIDDPSLFTPSQNRPGNNSSGKQENINLKNPWPRPVITRVCYMLCISI